VKFGLSYARVKRERRLEEVGAFPSRQAAYFETGLRNPGRNDWRYLALKNSNVPFENFTYRVCKNQLIKIIPSFFNYLVPALGLPS
jgi:hypothetical protein